MLAALLPYKDIFDLQSTVPVWTSWTTTSTLAVFLKGWLHWFTTFSIGLRILYCSVSSWESGMLVPSIQAQTIRRELCLVWCGVWDVPTRRGGPHMPNLHKVTLDRLIHIMVPSDYNWRSQWWCWQYGDDFIELYKNHSFVIFLSIPWCMHMLAALVPYKYM